jgi:hypothetical protein
MASKKGNPWWEWPSTADLDNYGCVPGTLASDGDPVDVLVLMDAPAFVGCAVTCRPRALPPSELVTPLLR